MADMLTAGVTWLASKMKASGSHSVIYTSKTGQILVGLQATVGETVHSYTDNRGLVIRVKTRDYIIEAADLNFGAGRVDPQRDDVISDEINGVNHSFRVLPAGNDPCFRWADSHGVRIRIHTKLIQTGA